MLHTLNKSPAQPGPFAACLAACSAGDALLLIEEGVYYVANGAALAQLQERGVTIHALTPDLAVRGLQPLAVAHVIPTDHAGFVALCRQHGRTQSWY